MAEIQIINAYEGNLKNISLTIPKNKLVVFTGLSGSGKSTLLVDVLFNECQRQFLEAMAFQGIHKPKVERIKGASAAIMISQTDANKNPRSTVGTVTNIYTDLRMVYEKLGVRTCPHCSAVISAADCKEETEKIGNDFYVYMYCRECGVRMDKLTRTNFSFNTREGACPACEGLGEIHTIDRDYVINETLSLEEGAVNYWEQKYGEYQISIVYAAFKHYGIPVALGTPVARYSEIQKAILHDGIDTAAVKKAFPQIKPPKTMTAGRFEGVFPILWRRLADKEGDTRSFGAIFHSVPCPDCGGERLCELSRKVTVNGIRLPELSRWSLVRVGEWLEEIKSILTEKQAELVQAYLRDMETKLGRFIKVGLGYLTLDRQVVTLSGGELQRLRLAAVLDSDLTGAVYILDEPTLGLHPKDTAGLVAILERLRDLENTVLVIEHDPDVMAAADYIVDIGPGSGKYGGEIVGVGTLAEIKALPDSATGEFLRNPPLGKTVFRRGGVTISNHKSAAEKDDSAIEELLGNYQTNNRVSRNVNSELDIGLLSNTDGNTGDGTVGNTGAEAKDRVADKADNKANRITGNEDNKKDKEVYDNVGCETEGKTDCQPINIINADKFNLKNITVTIPTGCLTTVTGPSGSGKSTLIFEVLAKSSGHAGHNAVTGLEQFAQVVEIGQAAVTKMKRSNVATYSEVYTEIRAIFAQTAEAKKAGLTAGHFSFNAPGGRCENCEGLGYIDSNMLFFTNIEVTCPVCNGNQFSREVLAVKYEGLSIKDVLLLSVEDAARFFAGHKKASRSLGLLQEVGLGYLELGQSLTTLSGGEAQRLKLAKELIGSRPDKKSLYLMDEPTVGLHPADVSHFLVLIDNLVAAGNTVVVVEHNQQVIKNSDWIIDLGPAGGEKGGEVIFTGTPLELLRSDSVTAKYL